MEKLNEKKLNVLIGSTETLNRYVMSLIFVPFAPTFSQSI